MPTTYSGATIPVATDLADGPEAFRDYTDSFASIDAMEAAAVPIGTILFTCRTVAPTGYLLLNGTTVAGGQTLYPDLWGVIPAAWKSGVDILLPNAQGKFPVAMNSADTSWDTVGESGGAKTVTLAIANLATHSHPPTGLITGSNSADHVHTAPGGAIIHGGSGGGPIYAGGIGGGSAAFTNTNSVDHTHSISGTTGPAGSGTAFSILPPYIAFPLMIRAA